MSPIVYIIMIGFVAVFGTGSFFFLNKAQEKKSRTRSLSVIRGHVPSDGKKSEKDQQDKRRAEIAKKLQHEGIDGKPKKKSGIKEKLIQAGFETSVKKFWIYSVICGVIFTILGAMTGRGPLILMLMWFIGTFGLPRYYLRRTIRRRQKKFLEDFADALEAMVRLLKAGMPVGEAIAMASREFEGPIGEEMSRIYDAQKIGISLSEATLEAARRMPITEMQMFATGISIQSQTGSSLSEVLTNLARVIRARFRLKRKVQALSSEAKASAMIIGSLPFIIGTGLYFINGPYMSVLFDTTKGQSWLIGCAVWMLLGCLVMRAMINFKI